MAGIAKDVSIAKQIEAQLKRTGLAPEHRFESANTMTLMAMVAAGAGWAITTPLLYARAAQFHGKLTLCPFPGKPFARTLSLVATPDCARSVQDLVHQRLRHLLDEQVVTPLHQTTPWLKERFTLKDL